SILSSSSSKRHLLYVLLFSERQIARPRFVALAGAVTVIELGVDGVRIWSAGVNITDGIGAFSGKAMGVQRRLAISADFAIEREQRATVTLVLAVQNAVRDGSDKRARIAERAASVRAAHKDIPFAIELL